MNLDSAIQKYVLRDLGCAKLVISVNVISSVVVRAASSNAVRGVVGLLVRVLDSHVTAVSLSDRAC